MTQPQLILHVGAPKCGSSTLQTALSKTPNMSARNGQKFHYVSARVHDSIAGNTVSTLYNAAVTRDGSRSPYGYSSLPDLSTDSIAAEFATMLRSVHRRALRQGFIPILSSEGWIGRHAKFAAILEPMGNPPVDVVAFLRPPLEWLNASYWQWGVWSTPNLSAWMDRAKMTYSFGEDLKAWSQIPNVRLRVSSSKPDIVTHFAGFYDLPLQAGHNTNSSSPPVLIGFLLRNRRFRPSPHASYVEFIVQRWCPKLNTRPAWSLGAPHVHRYRPVVAKNIAALREILSKEECDRLFSDPRWQEEKPYHSMILEGVSPLDDPTDLPLLLDSLQQGIVNAGGTPVHRQAPSDTTDLAAWDAVLSEAMDQLIERDRLVRRRVTSRSGIQLLVDRITSAFHS